MNPTTEEARAIPSQAHMDEAIKAVLAHAVFPGIGEENGAQLVEKAIAAAYACGCCDASAVNVEVEWKR